jgi:hypothetical protein
MRAARRESIERRNAERKRRTVLRRVACADARKRFEQGPIKIPALLYN